MSPKHIPGSQTLGHRGERGADLTQQKPLISERECPHVKFPHKSSENQGNLSLQCMTTRFLQLNYWMSFCSRKSPPPTKTKVTSATRPSLTRLTAANLLLGPDTRSPRQGNGFVNTKLHAVLQRPPSSCSPRHFFTITDAQAVCGWAQIKVHADTCALNGAVYGGIPHSGGKSQLKGGSCPFGVLGP